MNYNAEFDVKGTVVARAHCECCDTPVQIKTNKKGGAYYYCGGADDQGTPCCHSQRWGQRISWALRKAYLDAGNTPVKARLPIRIGREAVAAAATIPANDDHAPADNTNAAPQKQAAQASGGLFP